MGRLLFSGGSQRAEHEGGRSSELLLGGEAAAETLDQLLDDVAGLLCGHVLLVEGDREIGVQIASGAQAVVAAVGVVPVQRAIGADEAGAMLVPIGGRAEGRGQPPPVVCVGDHVAVAPVLVDRQQEDGDVAGAVVLQAVVGRQVELTRQEGAGAAGGVDQGVEEGAVQVAQAAGLAEVVAVAVVEGAILDDLLSQAEGAGGVMFQHDPALAGIVEGGAAGRGLECFFHGFAPFVLGGRPLGLACIFFSGSPARIRLSQCGQM